MREMSLAVKDYTGVVADHDLVFVPDRAEPQHKTAQTTPLRLDSDLVGAGAFSTAADFHVILSVSGNKKGEVRHEGPGWEAETNQPRPPWRPLLPAIHVPVAAPKSYTDRSHQPHAQP